MKTVNITVDYENIDSIEAAEKIQEILVNKGYHTVNTFGGMRHYVIVMGK